jgi:hypothetical protein
VGNNKCNIFKVRTQNLFGRTQETTESDQREELSIDGMILFKKKLEKQGMKILRAIQKLPDTLW